MGLKGIQQQRKDLEIVEGEVIEETGVVPYQPQYPEKSGKHEITAPAKFPITKPQGETETDWDLIPLRERQYGRNTPKVRPDEDVPFVDEYGTVYSCSTAQCSPTRNSVLTGGSKSGITREGRIQEDIAIVIAIIVAILLVWGYFALKAYVTGLRLS